MQVGALISDLIPWVFLAVLHLGLFWMIARTRPALPPGLLVFLWAFAWLAPLLLPAPLRWFFWAYMLAGTWATSAGRVSWLTAGRAMGYVAFCLGAIGTWYLLASGRGEAAPLGAAAMASAVLLLRKATTWLA
jgi:hypothetical protein